MLTVRSFLVLTFIGIPILVIHIHSLTLAQIGVFIDHSLTRLLPFCLLTVWSVIWDESNPRQQFCSYHLIIVFPFLYCFLSMSSLLLHLTAACNKNPWQILQTIQLPLNGATVPFKNRDMFYRAWLQRDLWIPHSYQTVILVSHWFPVHLLTHKPSDIFRWHKKSNVYWDGKFTHSVHSNLSSRSKKCGFLLTGLMAYPLSFRGHDSPAGTTQASI